jgi:hypothetical protein
MMITIRIKFWGVWLLVSRWLCNATRDLNGAAVRLMLKMEDKYYDAKLDEHRAKKKAWEESKHDKVL